MSAALATRIGALELEHPVMNASGTLDPLAARAAGLAIDAELALIVTKTVTPLAREGNAAPRVCEAAGGMLNSIGLPNPGLDAFAGSVLPAVRALGRPLVVSLGGFAPADYELGCRRLDGEPGIAALELNVSCPNVESGCISIGSDAAETEAVVRACRAETGLPLWVKLSPNVADIAAIARAAERGGADALVLTNTLRGLAIDHWTRAPLLGGVTGGLSGPALKPVALAAVHTCRSACALPLIGVGGIASGWDALEFLLAGATAIQVGSAAFREPLLARRVRGELATLLAERDLPRGEASKTTTLD
ncbi:MAG: dihydroorotate dehydrogenase catalytic subunit [Gaiellales bacterium]|nr:dihydroorotate dehydrogenase catalytic subunit [Gaiellales bacterium]